MDAPVALDSTPTEIADPTESTPADDTASLADHEAAFSRDPKVRAEVDREREDETAQERADRDDKGRFRHRSQSQRATVDDVAQINALTKELRALEADLVKKQPDALSGSPRLRALQRQIKALKAETADSTPAPVAKVSTPTREMAFTDAEPKLEDFNAEADPYAAYVRALARHDRKKESFEEQQGRTVSEQREADEKLVSAYHANIATFAQQTPDFQEVAGPLLARQIPLLLVNAIVRSDKPGPTVYYLGQHPELVDELFLLTEGKPITDAHVAIVQRRLSQHAQAATTGSAAVARPAFVPPRPPNPVRTGPIRTGEDLPGDESSLADHEKAFGPKRRR